MPNEIQQYYDALIKQINSLPDSETKTLCKDHYGLGRPSRKWSIDVPWFALWCYERGELAARAWLPTWLQQKLLNHYFGKNRVTRC